MKTGVVFRRYGVLVFLCGFALGSCASPRIAVEERPAPPERARQLTPFGDTNPAEMLEMGGVLYFAGRGVGGVELWRSDGTEFGTKEVADVNPYGSALGGEIAVVGSTLYFSASDGMHGSELWKSDGTASGTVMVADICFGSKGSDPADLAAAGDVLYFSADDGVRGVELWVTDGTASGTTMVSDIRAGLNGSDPNRKVFVGGVLFFTADDGRGGRELWRSDGTAPGTYLVRDIALRGSAEPKWIREMGGIVFFSADDGISGRELWRSDGSEGGTFVVKDINAGPSGSDVCSVFVGADAVFFRADDGFAGAELWKSDGTEAGTSQVRDINTGTLGSDPLPFARLGSSVLLVANDGINGRELWRSDGTDPGTALVRDINPGPFSAFPAVPVDEIEDRPIVLQTEVGGTVHFPANDGARGIEVWGSDGSAAGTRLIKELNPFGDSVDDLGVVWRSRSMAAAGGGLFANATDGSAGRMLWIFERQ